MLNITVILIIVTVIVLFEVPYLLKKRYIRDIWFFSIFLSIATSLSIAMALKVSLPNPLNWISFVYKPFSNLIMNTFQ